MSQLMSIYFIRRLFVLRKSAVDIATVVDEMFALNISDTKIKFNLNKASLCDR